MVEEEVVLCREAEQAELESILQLNVPLPEHVHLSGLHGSGKSLIVRKAISRSMAVTEKSFRENDRCILHIYDSALRFGNLPRLLESLVKIVIAELIRLKTGNEKVLARMTGKEQKVTTLAEFIRILEILTSNGSGNPFVVFIVVDDAESLRSLLYESFFGLLRIAEFSSIVSFSVITVSAIPLRTFYPGRILGIGTLTIHLDSYSQRDVMEILRTHYEEIRKTMTDGPGMDIFGNMELFSQFLHIYWQNLTLRTSSIPEMKRMLFPLYKSYVHPIIKGEIAIDEAGKLYSNLMPLLQNYEGVFRSTTSKHFPPRNLDSAISLNDDSIRVLIAAFIASRYEPVHDWMFFEEDGKTETSASKVKSRKRKRRVKSRDNRLIERKLHLFGLERLFAIKGALFAFELEEEYGDNRCNQNFFSIVSTLEGMNYLLRASRDENLETAKYRCNASESQVETVAKQISFDLSAFVH